MSRVKAVLDVYSEVMKKKDKADEGTRYALEAVSPSLSKMH